MAETAFPAGGKPRGLQSILKTEPGLIEDELAVFREQVSHVLGKGEFDIEFGYRMRIGIK